MPSDVDAPRPQMRSLRGGEIAAFVISSIVLLFASFVASTLGGFLGYAGTVTTLSGTAFNTVMTLAVAGPWLMAVVLIVWGMARLAQRRRAWPFPLIGVPMLWAFFYGCAFVLGS